MTQTSSSDLASVPGEDTTNGDLDLLDLAAVLAARWRPLLAVPLAAGVLALGATSLIAPTFTSRTTFLPPQQQSSGASALASLGALAGLAGGAVGIKAPGDQYVALMQSVKVADRIVDRFKLMEVYEAKYRFLARKELEQNSRISLGKKDGLITVEVDAKEPAMAAEIANQYVAEFRRLSSELALTEAQQRRVLFEGELKTTRDKLTAAQFALQGSGFNPGALKSEPKAAADSYARLKAETTTADIRLQTLRRNLTDASPEVQQQLAIVSALNAQLRALESSAPRNDETDYMSKYREFKYQEMLFDLFAKQYELARLDESREGALIQVVDVATPPERKSKPQRMLIGLATSIATFVSMLVLILLRRKWIEAKQSPSLARKLEVLRSSFGKR